jgi:hypothetical protein
MDKANKTGKSTKGAEKQMDKMLNKPKKGVTNSVLNKAATRVSTMKKK